MPQALIGAITPYIASFLFGVGGNALVVAATGLLASALVYGGLAAVAYLASAATAPTKPEAPKPEDGKYNLKQSVPPLVYVLGKNKKAGDYAFLEETGGIAYHITVLAAHRIKGFVSHWLHDEQVTLDGSGFVTTPTHFISGGANKVRILTRLGAAVSTAYTEIFGVFPSIWTSEHRGDGLATVMMSVNSVAAEDLTKAFTSGMPQHQAIIEGHDQLTDPRTGIAGYSENLALFRYWHLAHPVGAKLTLQDLYAQEWAHDADVCDGLVTNRVGATEPRYHGGLWFRATNDPVQIGRLMDQAADHVIYERADGKIGVHAGEFVAPDVRLTDVDLISVSYDANKRRATNVLAVRGRFTDPGQGFNTVDAAIYGAPYPSDDERTKTVENQAVQRHNHMARMQKLAFIRANAPRVKIVAHYEPARNVPYRRFITVHYPPKMTEAVVEITGRPTLSLRNLTYTFEGIVVPSSLYAFDAASEEGAPGSNVVPIGRQDVPLPAVSALELKTEVVTGGSTAAYILATYSLQNVNFQYELTWQPTAGGPTSSTLSSAGQLTARTSYLADGVQYRVRTRTWSSGSPSGWSDYVNVTATADPTAPGIVTSVTKTGGAGQVTFGWTAPNSSNYFGTRIYVNTASTFAGSTLVATEYGPANIADTRVITGLLAGTKYGFLVAINGSGVAAAEVATGSFVVT